MATHGYQLRRALQYGVAPYGGGGGGDDDDSDGDHQQRLPHELHSSTPRPFASNWDESVFLFCAAGLGLVLNVCVVLRVAARPEVRRSAGGAFVVHSCLLDAVKCLFCFPFAVSLLLDREPSHCSLLGGAFVLVVTASGFNIVAMVCCEAYRFSERDSTDLRDAAGAGFAAAGVASSSSSPSFSSFSALGDEDEAEEREGREGNPRRTIGRNERKEEEEEEEFPTNGLGVATFTPSRRKGYRRFDDRTTSTFGSNCRGLRDGSRSWFQVSEPNLCDSSGVELGADGPTSSFPFFGSQPHVSLDDRTPAVAGVHRCQSDRSVRVGGDVESPTRSRRRVEEEDEEREGEGENHDRRSGPGRSTAAPPSGRKRDGGEGSSGSRSCVFFGIVMVYVGSLVVHLGPTIIGGDFDYNDPIGNCLFAYGSVKSYVVQAMWVVIMSLAMVGALFYLVRFDRHVESKTGRRRLAVLVRSSVAATRIGGGGGGRCGRQSASLELRRASLGRVRVLYLLTGVFVACWYPLYVLTLADPKFQRSVKLYKLLTFVAWSNSSINPLVLILFDRDVGLSSTSDCRPSRRRPPTTTATATTATATAEVACGRCPCATSSSADRDLVPSAEPAPDSTLTRASPLPGQTVLTPSRSADSGGRLDSKTKAQLEAMEASRRQLLLLQKQQQLQQQQQQQQLQQQGRDLCLPKADKPNFLSLLGVRQERRKLSKQDLIHLRRIGSRLGTSDTLPLSVGRLSSTFQPPHPQPPQPPQLHHRHPDHHHHHHHRQQHHHHVDIDDEDDDVDEDYEGIGIHRHRRSHHRQNPNPHPHPHHRLRQYHQPHRQPPPSLHHHHHHHHQLLPHHHHHHHHHRQSLDFHEQHRPFYTYRHDDPGENPLFPSPNAHML